MPPVPDSVCGDGVCDFPNETADDCSSDCEGGLGDYYDDEAAVCGNGVCETYVGENCVTCPSDCAYSLVFSDASFTPYCCGGLGRRRQRRREGATATTVVVEEEEPPSVDDGDEEEEENTRDPRQRGRRRRRRQRWRRRFRLALSGCDDDRCTTEERSCASRPDSAWICGDDVCSDVEQRDGACPHDCGSFEEEKKKEENDEEEEDLSSCGNGVCETFDENCRTCPEDCNGSEFDVGDDSVSNWFENVANYCCGDDVDCSDLRCRIGSYECNDGDDGDDFFDGLFPFRGRRI